MSVPKNSKKKATPGAKKLDCYCALRFKEKKQRPVLEIGTDCTLRFEKKATPGAGKLDCYWSLNFERKELQLIFAVSTGNSYCDLKLEEKSNARCWKLRL